jgi:hypothetical protein
MPFKKTGKDEYTSPSGKKYKKAQVQAYYAKTKGQPKSKRKASPKKVRDY